MDSSSLYYLRDANILKAEVLPGRGDAGSRRQGAVAGDCRPHRPPPGCRKAGGDAALRLGGRRVPSRPLQVLSPAERRGVDPRGRGSRAAGGLLVEGSSAPWTTSVAIVG